MRKIALSFATFAAIIVLILPATPAQALDAKTFVRSDGSGSTCTRGSPCGTVAAAVAAAVDGGEVNCLDSGPIQGGLINKSITIDCAGSPATVVPAAFGGTGIVVNGAGIVVKIRNLTLNGTTSSIGIDFVNGAALFVENCVVMNFNSSPALGIRFNPSAAGSQLAVTDTVIDNNGIAPSTGGGIQVAPAGGSAGVVLNRVRLGFNVTAMVLSGAIGAVLRDSVVNSSRANSVIVGNATLTVERSSLLNNKGPAIITFTGAFIRIGDSTIAGNESAIGCCFFGGTVQSFKENHIAGNGNDNTPLTAFPGPGGTPLQ